jgi:signal recognition particle receptor subunit beta
MPPKVLKFAVMGLTGTGATAFIQSTENNHWGTGRLDLRVKLGLLPRAQDQWEIVLADKAGILMMVDSAKPETFPDVVALMQTEARFSSAPQVIIANKQDLPAALKPDAIRQRLGLDGQVAVIPCVTKSRQSSSFAMRQVVDWVLQL